MELMDVLDKQQWQKENNPGNYEFKRYTLGHRATAVNNGTFQYTANCRDPTDEEDENLKIITLHGASGKTNPLKDVINCQLIVKDAEIVGINVDDDCVVKASIKK